MIYQNNKGYIVITTTIIVTLTLLMVGVTLSSASLLSRLGTAGYVDKKLTYFLARSCLEYARLQLSLNPGYGGNETRVIDAYQCTINPIEMSGGNYIIKSSANNNDVFTNLQLTIDALNLSTVFLMEAKSH